MLHTWSLLQCQSLIDTVRKDAYDSLSILGSLRKSVLYSIQAIDLCEVCVSCRRLHELPPDTADCSQTGASIQTELQ